MQVLQRPHKAGERVVALGMFDGVHRGHRTLLLNAKRLADEMGIPLRVCTFNRHPLEIIRPENPPEMISTIPERASLLYGIGVDEMELIPFDQSTADMEPGQNEKLPGCQGCGCRLELLLWTEGTRNGGTTEG